MNPPSMARKKMIIGNAMWQAITDPLPLKATPLRYVLVVIILPHDHSLVWPVYKLINPLEAVIEVLKEVSIVAPPATSLSVTL